MDFRTITRQNNNLEQTRETKVLIDSIIEGIQDKKGHGITVLDMHDLHERVCDYMIIAEGNTNTQLRSLEGAVWDKTLEKVGEKPLRTHVGGGEWIGMDYGNVIVHLFLPKMREYYRLEQLWADAEVMHIPDLD